MFERVIESENVVEMQGKDISASMGDRRFIQERLEILDHKLLDCGMRHTYHFVSYKVII